MFDTILFDLDGTVLDFEANQEQALTKLFCSRGIELTEEMRQYCGLSEECAELMRQAFDAMGLTARSYDRILRVARTIADLEGDDIINEMHILEAVQYRDMDREV